MPERLGLTHREAVILMDEVFAPFMRQWQADERLRPLVEDREAYHHFLAEMAQVLGVLLHGRGDALAHLTELCRQAQAVGLPLEAVERYAQQFLQTFGRWVRQADEALLEEPREAVLQRLEKLQADQVHCAEGEEDGFVMAHSEHMDETIDSMHNITAGREAISAEAFMAQGYLDEDTVARIVDDINELSSELYFYGAFDREYAAFVMGHLEEISHALDATMEFEDLAWAVRQFIHVLDNLPDDLNEELATAVKQLTDQFVEDLVGWVNHVLVERDAQDIHYLDAAMLASVKQIALILGIQLEERGGASQAGAAAPEGGDDDFVMF